MDMNGFKLWLDGYTQAKGGSLGQFDIDVIKAKLDEVYPVVPQVQPFQPFCPNWYYPQFPYFPVYPQNPWSIPTYPETYPTAAPNPWTITYLTDGIQVQVTPPSTSVA